MIRLIDMYFKNDNKKGYPQIATINEMWPMLSSLDSQNILSDWTEICRYGDKITIDGINIEVIPNLGEIFERTRYYIGSTIDDQRIKINETNHEKSYWYYNNPFKSLIA